jgi:hypothetical protein
MSKKEFYLQAMLHMAANPKYVEVEPSKDMPDVKCHILLQEEISMDAERLLKEAEKQWPEAFEEEDDYPDMSIKQILGDMCVSIGDMKESLGSICTSAEQISDNT